jgi:phosphoribosylformylglycinamidine synthase
MLKPEILDPQGQAVQRALPRLGFEGISDVRQGKRFELEVDGPVDDTVLTRIRELAESFLANTVIENFDVKIEDFPDASGNAQNANAANTANRADNTTTAQNTDDTNAPNAAAAQANAGNAKAGEGK